MKLLLDTHSLLWSIGNSSELSEIAKDAISNLQNHVFVSAVSLWETSLKYSIGKLHFTNFDIFKIPYYCKEMGFTLIPLSPQDALDCVSLPIKDNHRDPFDRMLIFQCIINKYIFISKDTHLSKYKSSGLKYLW